MTTSTPDPAHRPRALPAVRAMPTFPSGGTIPLDPFDPFGNFGQEPVETLSPDWTAQRLGAQLARWSLDDLQHYLDPIGGLCAIDAHGYTVLMGLAMQNNDPTPVGQRYWDRCLIDAGVPVNHQAPDGHSAFSLALQHHQPMLARRLLAAGAHPYLPRIRNVPLWSSNAVVPDGPTVEASTVHLALLHEDLLNVVLDANPTAIHADLGHACTPLQQALVRGISTAVQVLVRRGAVVNGDPSNPPLTLGLPALSPSAIRALVHAGADPCAANDQGMTPLDLMAQSSAFDDVARYHRRARTLALLDLGVRPDTLLQALPAQTVSISLDVQVNRAAVPAGSLLERLLHERDRRHTDWTLVLHLVERYGMSLDVPDHRAIVDDGAPQPTLWDRVNVLSDVKRTAEQDIAYRTLWERRVLREALDPIDPPARSRPRSRL